MAKRKESWPSRHFSLGNPAGPGQGDVPALLRRVADSIAERGPVQVQDLLLHMEFNEHGYWPSITVYFSPPDAPDVGRKTASRAAVRRLDT